MIGLLETNLANSNQINPTMPGMYNIVQDTLTKTHLKVDGFDIVKEQEKDEVLLALTNQTSKR